MSADEGTAAGAEAAAVPMLRVLKGDPSDEDLAALVAVLAAVRPAGSTEGMGRSRSLWTARDRLVDAPLMPRRGAWRASALPQ